MATDTAHEGIRKILRLLDENDVKQLASTTTQNKIKPETLKNKEDAVEVIIRYSADYSTILNRKSVKRDILFQYLHDKRIFATPPVTKLSLIQKILEYWALSSNIQQSICNENENSEKEKEPCSTEEINLMAYKFTEWFYNMLNADECIGQEHFWEDCSVQINLISASSTVEHTAENDRNQVVNLLYNTKCEHGLIFNPNLSSDGIFGKMDIHGLVVIFVCGTLHTQDNCVGVFEQIFSLARDPYCENNWKIKHTRLNLRNKGVTETPKLCDTGISKDVFLSLSK